MLRLKSSPIDPKSEEAEAQRNSILNDKEHAQKEMLDIADVKKKLLKDIKDIKSGMDMDFEYKKKELDIKIFEVEIRLKNLKQNEDKLIKSNSNFSVLN